MNNLKRLALIALLSLLSIASYAEPATVTFLVNQYSQSFNQDVQKEILKTLGNYQQTLASRNLLLQTVSSPRIAPRLRAQAAQSLSPLVADIEVLNTIIRAHDTSRDVWLRSKLLESIYPAVSRDHRIQNVLMNNLRQANDVSIQLASAFALGKNLKNSSIKNFLLQYVDYSFQNPRVKIEVLKSFATSLNDPAIKSTLLRMTSSPSQSNEVRSAAIRVMATAPKTRSSRQLLFDLMVGQQPSGVRAQAAAGLSFKLQDDDIEWLRLEVDPRSGLKRNPFSKI